MFFWILNVSYKNRCYSLISNEVYLFSQTVLYINPPQIILFATFCKVSAELYRPSGLLFLFFMCIFYVYFFTRYH